MIGGLKLRIAIILIAGAILAVFLALFTSHGIEQRLSQTTDAIFDLSTGVRNQPLPVSGPPELSRLSNAFNTLSSKLDESEQSSLKITEIKENKKGIYSISIITPKGDIAKEISSIPVIFYLNKNNTNTTH